MRSKLLPGNKYHRLTVVGLSHVRLSPSGSRRQVILCKCQCGVFTYVDGGNLTGQHPVKSCGCANEDNLRHRKEHGVTHGKSWTPTWHIWVNVVARGTGREQPEKYFNRGITVCERWLKFENFYEDMGERPTGLSIGRIDNDAGYSPENCRWETYAQQARNTRKTVRLEYQGVIWSQSDLAEKYSMTAKNLAARLKLGWTLERALNTPINGHLNLK